MNLYAYALVDPVNLNDPSGLDVNIPITSGGSPQSCLNHTLEPWLASHGFTLGNNFNNFASTITGTLGLTLYFEDTTGSATFYDDLAQVLINRFQLQESNPGLAAQLGLPTPGTQAGVIEQSSQVWTPQGTLQSGIQQTLITLMNGNVVGAAAAVNAAACNNFISAVSVAYTAQNYFSGAVKVPGENVSSGAYWFFTPGHDPVKHQFWNTTSTTVDGWVFETLVGPKRRPAPPRKGSPKPREDIASPPRTVGGPQ
jgi:hypothetical protein